MRSPTAAPDSGPVRHGSATRARAVQIQPVRAITLSAPLSGKK
jgi:hypothetical protein